MKSAILERFLAGALVLAVMPLAASLRAQMVEPAAMRGMKALLVAGEADKEHPSDDPLVKEHLESMGFEVTVVDESAPASSADGKNLVVISSTAQAQELKDAYKSCPVPVLTWSAFGYPYLAMTGEQLHTDFEVLDGVRSYGRTMAALYPFCVNATHPIAKAAGLPSQVFGPYYLQSTESTYGKPAPAAQIISVLEGYPDRASIFTYEKGASMCTGFVAPARRVGFYLSSANFHLLSYITGPYANDPNQKTWWVGRKLFDACVRWAVSAPPAPPKYDPAALRAELGRAAKGIKLLFVRRNPAEEGQEADEHMLERLKSFGFVVTDRDAEEPADTTGQDFVMISSTCSKFKLTNKYNDVKVPLLNFECLMADCFKMSTRHRYVDYGMHGEAGESEDPPESFIDIVGAWHPLAAGLSAGAHQFVKEADLIKWVKPMPGAVIVATVPGRPDQAAIFGYEKGSTLADESLAPSRRMCFPLDNPQFDDLTDEGMALFDAAVLWCISKPAE